MAAALVYVDWNPLRAGLAGAAEQYPWSSARKHLGGRDAADLVEDPSWVELGLEAEWRHGWRRLLAAARSRNCVVAPTPDCPAAQKPS